MPVSDCLPLSGSLCLQGRLQKRGVPHGLTLRALGDMKSPQARAEACRAAGVREPLLLRQRHGTVVLEATGPEGQSVLPAPAAGPSAAAPSGSGERLPSGDRGPLAAGTAREEEGLRAEGDGWVSSQKGLTLGVFAADCLPIFLWDEEGLEAVGVFHAGWRGTASGMPRCAVESFGRLGLAPGRLAAFIGPHVGACCYRVGPELEDRFRPGSFQRRPEGLFLDLAADAAAQLREAGVGEGRIEVSQDCTACRSDLYFSFRREKQDRRMLAFIAKP